MFGRHGDPDWGSKPDVPLFAADILPRHCCFQRQGVSSPTTLCPCQDAAVTRNGEVLTAPVQLNPGDVIGLGERYLFLFKDPLSLAQKVNVEERTGVKEYGEKFRFLYINLQDLFESFDISSPTHKY